MKEAGEFFIKWRRRGGSRGDHTNERHRMSFIGVDLGCRKLRNCDNRCRSFSRHSVPAVGICNFTRYRGLSCKLENHQKKARSVALGFLFFRWFSMFHISRTAGGE